MDEKTAAALRKPFEPGLVGKLPRVTCPDCSDRRKTCQTHSKSRCGECGNWVSTQHIHIDYVGHADVTSRLLEVDPEWNWAPLGTDEHGLPVFDTDEHGNPVGLWIRLEVGGITRLGYGSAPSGQADAVKVLIGDALRNAAMRFGVALDLWAKGDRADPTAENATASAGQAQRRGRQQQNGGDWENARPAAPRNGTNGNGRPAGQVSRPAATPKPAAANGEPDPDAQPFADEAHEARTLSALRAIQTKAREEHKLAALIRNPASGGVGGLGAFIDYHRKRLTEIDAALKALSDGADPEVDLDAHVRKVTGAGIEDATAVQLRQAAEALKAGAPA